VQLGEPIAVERAPDLAADANGLDHTRAAKPAKVPREERLGQAQSYGELGHGVLALGREQLQDPEARVVAEGAVVRAQVADGSLGQRFA
jgi:cystathionine beta-lyase family protein involved in aluminum resistance